MVASHASYGYLNYYIDYGTAPGQVYLYSNSTYVDGYGVILETAVPDMPAPPGYVFAGWFDAENNPIIANVTKVTDIAHVGTDDAEMMYIYEAHGKFYKIYHIQSEILKNIADAVRRLQGTTDKYTPEEIPDYINVPYEEVYTTDTTKTIYISKGEGGV